jgi:hypothetical protein
MSDMARMSGQDHGGKGGKKGGKKGGMNREGKNITAGMKGKGVGKGKKK